MATTSPLPRQYFSRDSVADLPGSKLSAGRSFSMSISAAAQMVARQETETPFWQQAGQAVEKVQAWVFSGGCWTMMNAAAARETPAMAEAALRGAFLLAALAKLFELLLQSRLESYQKRLKKRRLFQLVRLHRHRR